MGKSQENDITTLRGLQDYVCRRQKLLSGIRNHFHKVASLLEKRDQGCGHSLGQNPLYEHTVQLEGGVSCIAPPLSSTLQFRTWCN